MAKKRVVVPLEFQKLLKGCLTIVNKITSKNLLLESRKDHSKKFESSDSDNDEEFVFPVDGIEREELRVVRNEEKPLNLSNS